MSKEIYISSTPHETRLAIVEKEELSEIYYERENEYTLAGSIYNGRVTRVLPGMQSAFVDVGLERDAFLYITDFMEEQGESADFDGGGEARRGSPERSGERSERGDRGGDRGRGRDRDRGGERNGRGREQEPRVAAPDEFSAVEPVFPEPQELAGAPEATPETGEETGEGSRRWRGRRGRRRGGRSGEGRGPAEGGEATPHGEATPQVDEEFAGGSDEPESGSMERVYGQEEAAAPVAREERGRGGRDRDRGGRGRDRDRGGDRGGDRGRRPERFDEQGGGSAPELAAGAEPMILPGESLSRYRKGDDGESAAGSSASVPAAAKPSYLTARPSTEIDLSTAAWDGGFTLPGETLSRRRGQPEAPRAEARGEDSFNNTNGNDDEQAAGADAERATEGASLGSNRRRDRDRRRGRGGRGESVAPAIEAGTSAEEESTPTSFRSGVVMHESLHPMDAVQPGVSSEHEPEGTPLPAGESLMAAVGTSDDVPEFEIEAFEAQREAEATVADDVIYEPETDVVPANQGPSEALIAAVESMHAGVELEPAHAGEEFHEETHEYEPGEDASASYRVDPAGPSEFRQSGLAEDDDVSEGDPAVQEDYAGTEHQITTIQDGEMLSELPGEVSVPGAEEDPSNPIEHETAVLSEQATELLNGTPTAQLAEAGGAQGESQDPAQAFAPGQGELEEEFLDEDETEVLDVAASYGDDIEEETLEAGAEISAQLGSLVRDRTLDEMTHGETVVIGDDDFDIDDEEMEEDELEGDEEIAAGDVADLEEDDVLEGDEAFDEEGDKPAAASMGEFPEFAEERAPREPRRGGSEDRGSEGRREGRRSEGRNGDRDRGGRDRGGRGDRRGMAGSRSGGRNSRHSMQNTDLPAISDLLKPGQEVLVQIAKEPIAKKGARITSHIALPGRFLVFMPTVNHVGVSRKIESDGERRRLKEILLSEKGDAAGGFIVRTAASGASEDELRSDLRFLLNLWAEIKQRSESSKSPALIYHDLNLVERILRDQVSENFSAIWCDTETEYERVLRFLQRFQPSLMRRVKLYTKDTPLFEQFGISEEINKALRSKVWLKSGGSIVINQTEALVAIDINTGKYVGKTARLEDTIVKTNLDAIPEIVRQIRLRDLGGIIVIDFIDMDDRKNRQKVLIALEEELKKDRAPSKVLQFNDFGLVAITRKRVKQSLERTLSTTCGICAGTGMVKSPVTVCNEIYIELRKMHKQLDRGDVMLRVNPEVVKQLKSNNAKWLQEMEEIAGKTILIKSDPSLHPEQFDIH